MEETLMETDVPGPIHNYITEELISEPLITGAEEVLFQYPTLFSGRTLLELCNSSWSSSPKAKVEVQPYLRGCKWSPDGTCCLSVVNNDGVHVTELPRDLYSESAAPNRTIDVLDSVIHVKEAGLVYDFSWYPGMNSSVPESCCWLTTRQNAPVQMWDAFDGSLRCSYRGFNPVDEMEPAVTVAFTLDGARIVAGYKKVLRTFDVERPGRDCAEHKITFPASCFAMDSNMLAVGSWNTTINLFNVNEMGGYKSIGKMHGHSGGITHMKFTPDGLKLVSGARKDHRLLVWDIRYYRRPLNILSRVVDTNQRIYFDISPCGKYLVTGGTDGILKVWTVDAVDWKNSLDVTDVEGDNATFKFPMHKDCCNSVSIHPFRPILATGSGQYHFRDPIQDDSGPNGQLGTNPIQDNSETNVQLNNASLKLNENLKFSCHAENSLVFWWVGDVPELSDLTSCFARSSDKIGPLGFATAATAFTPDGLKLVSGARKDHRLLVWDIRYYRRPLNILSRVVDTNQRIYFDISPCGKYLVTGGTDGILKVWTVDAVDWKNSLDVTDVEGDNATFKFPMHKDCCNSVSIHPFRPILATGSGQYHFRDPIQDDSGPNGQLGTNPIQDNSETNVQLNNASLKLNENLKFSCHAENSLVFWWVGDVPELSDLTSVSLF